MRRYFRISCDLRLRNLVRTDANEHHLHQPNSLPFYQKLSPHHAYDRAPPPRNHARRHTLGDARSSATADTMQSRVGSEAILESRET